MPAGGVFCPARRHFLGPVREVAGEAVECAAGARCRTELIQPPVTFLTRIGSTAGIQPRNYHATRTAGHSDTT